jgi:hypothetical protein
MIRTRKPRKSADRFPCTRLDCPVGDGCSRNPLKTNRPNEFGRGAAVKSRRGQARLRPFRQGHLDGLCGIYALINGIRLATTDHLDLTRDEWRDVFAWLLAKADDDLDPADLVTGGIGPRRLIGFAHHAIDHFAHHHGLKLAVSRPLVGLHRPPGPKLVAKLCSLVGQPGSAILIRLSGDFDHWTVVRSVGHRYLNLFDSCGFQRIRIDRCRARHEPKPGATVDHVLHPGWIIRLSIED